MNSEKWIKIWFSILILIGLIPYVFVYYFLALNFENNTSKEIVERQISKNSIYGTALNQDTFNYKLELVKITKPKIVAIGSSRVMPFRKENFNVSFITTGGSMGHLNEGYKLLKEMYKFHKPEYIILGLDFWWFTDSFTQPVIEGHHDGDGKYISINKIYKTFKWLISGKIDNSLLLNLLSSHNNTINQYTNYDNLGLSAKTTSTGFRSDGSHFYSNLIFGLKESSDKKFNNTFERIKNGNNRFQYGKHISEDRVLILSKILSFVKNNNTKIIVFIPPIANAIYKKMANYEYNFIDEFRLLVKSLKVENYDYHNVSKLTPNDCEFVDGFHGGEIVYSRILKNMYDNNSSISKYIDIFNVNKRINLFQGNTLIVNSDDIFSNKEVDFLRLGCVKNKIKLNTP